MRYKIFSFFLAYGMILFSSCNKDDGGGIIQPPPQPAVKLKEITIPNLPSPYYHFDYTEGGMIDKTSFASGLRSYDVLYDGNKIAELKSTHVINKDRLQYVYDENGKVALIKYTDESSAVYKRAFFTFNGNRLQSIEWERKENSGYIPERTLAFRYQPDGNLFEMTDERHAIPGQVEATYESRFEQYDAKLNMDGFNLVHDNADHLLLLPGVVLQRNNPSRLIFTGTGVNYTIDYSYTYDDNNAPVTKSGDGVFTSGPAEGQTFKTAASFSYY